jgi:hypothetical protein
LYIDYILLLNSNKTVSGGDEEVEKKMAEAVGREMDG